MDIRYIIAYLSTASVLIPLLVIILNKSNKIKYLVPLRAILVISLVCDVLSIILSQYSINTMWIGNFFFLIQFTLLLKIFSDELDERKISLYVFITFIAFYIVNMAFFQGPLIFNSVSFVIASFIMVIYSMYYFYRLLSEMPAVYIHKLPILWLAFAVLIYHAGNFFVFLVSNYFIEGNAEGYRTLWTFVHNFLNITKNILFAVALWQSYRTLKSST